MLNLKLDSKTDQELKVLLCLGAHSDDIEIGCGGSVLRIIEENPNIHVWWIVFSAVDRRENEAQQSANQFISGVKQKQVIVKDFRDGYFPYQGAEIKDQFEGLKKQINPDLIFTHFRDDLHQDHRVINELTWNTWRDHLILEYEIPKYDGDLGKPNFYIPLQRSVCEKKNQILMSVFQSQKSKTWFAAQTFWAMLQLRGIECRSPESLAEAFYARKIVI